MDPELECGPGNQTDAHHKAVHFLSLLGNSDLNQMTAALSIVPMEETHSFHKQLQDNNCQAAPSSTSSGNTKRPDPLTNISSSSL